MLFTLFCVCADEDMQDVGSCSATESEGSDEQEMSEKDNDDDDDDDEQIDGSEIGEEPEDGDDDEDASHSEEQVSDEEDIPELRSRKSRPQNARGDAKSSATASSSTLSVAERVARARAVSSTRILTAADFERIRANQSGKLARLTVSTKGARTGSDSTAADSEAPDVKRSRADSNADGPEQIVVLPQQACATILR